MSVIIQSTVTEGLLRQIKDVILRSIQDTEAIDKETLIVHCRELPMTQILDAIESKYNIVQDDKTAIVRLEQELIKIDIYLNKRGLTDEHIDEIIIDSLDY